MFATRWIGSKTHLTFRDTYGKTIREKGPLFDLESTKGHMAKVLEKEISIHVDNVPLEAILVNLSQTSGINIVADKSLSALKQVLSANLDEVKLEEFLRYIGRNYDLQFQVGNERSGWWTLKIPRN